MKDVELPEDLPPIMATQLYKVLKTIISRRGNAYKSTIAEDAALLKDPTVQGRQRIAIEICLGEKEFWLRLPTKSKKLPKLVGRIESCEVADFSTVCE